MKLLPRQGADVAQDSSVPLSAHHVIARRDAEILRLARVSDLRLPPAPHVPLLSSLCDVLWQDLGWGPHDSNERKAKYARRTGDIHFYHIS